MHGATRTCRNRKNFEYLLLRDVTRYVMRECKDVSLSTRLAVLSLFASYICTELSTFLWFFIFCSPVAIMSYVADCVFSSVHAPCYFLHRSFLFFLLVVGRAYRSIAMILNLPCSGSVAGEPTCRRPVRGSTRWPQSHLPAGSALRRVPGEYLTSRKSRTSSVRLGSHREERKVSHRDRVSISLLITLDLDLGCFVTLNHIVVHHERKRVESDGNWIGRD